MKNNKNFYKAFKSSSNLQIRGKKSNLKNKINK